MANGLAVDSSSGAIYASGTTSGFGAGGLDLVTLKFDPTIELLWERTWGEIGDDYGGGKAVDSSSGDVYVTGSPTSAKVLFLKLTSNGALLSPGMWVRRNGNLGSRIVVDSHGDVVMTGYVCCEGPPYSLTLSGKTTLGTPSFSLMVPAFDFAAPAVVLGSPSGVLQQPSGSETYSGSEEVFLFKYGSLPTIIFETNTGGGSIVSNGTTYANAQKGNYSYGTATALANPATGYIFLNWTGTGGINIPNPSSNPTTVIITGAGSVRANFQAATAPLSAWIIYVALGVGAMGVGVIGFLWTKRRKRSISVPKTSP